MSLDPLREVRNRLLNGWQLSKLYTFEVAARHQSFALAADELSLSPSAVSHRINQLEDELGIQLFVRSHRKVELTHEGKRVFWALKSSLDTLNQEILDIKNQELSGTLTVYSRPSIAQCWLVPALGDFTRRYPSISLTILTGNDNVNLQRAGVDLALYFDDAPSAQLEHHFLMDEAILPVCSPDYAQRFDLMGSLVNLSHCTLLHDRQAQTATVAVAIAPEALGHVLQGFGRDAGAVVGYSNNRSIREYLGRYIAAAGVNDNIHFRLIGADGNTANNICRNSQALQHLFYFRRGFACAFKISANAVKG
mgnify:CR=1 FL=1